MKNFIFKSNDSDLQKMFQYLETKLDVQNSNILYITHQTDKILKLVKQLETNLGLQHQVDEYFEEDAENKAEQVPET